MASVIANMPVTEAADKSSGIQQQRILLHLFTYFWLHWVFAAVQAFSSCGTWRLLFTVVLGLFMVVASLIVECKL